MLTDLQKMKLIPEAIKGYMNRTGATQADLSRLSKVESTKMNYICKGELKTPNQSGGTTIKDKYYLAICDVIGYKIEPEKKVWKHFHTDNFKAIIKQITEVRAEHGRGTIDGDTGSGKSHALAIYQKKYPVNTFIVKCDPTENAKELARSLANVLELEDHGTTGSIVKRVCEKLLTKDNAILIIDEAEHIKSKQGYINIVKSIADRLENQVAFMLSGMDINEILQKAADKHKQNFRQTARRFSKRMRCFDDIADDIRKIGAEFGFSDGCINWLVMRIKNFGELEVIVSAALKESQLSGTVVTVELLNSLYQ